MTLDISVNLSVLSGLLLYLNSSAEFSNKSEPCLHLSVTNCTFRFSAFLGQTISSINDGGATLTGQAGVLHPRHPARTKSYRYS